VDADDLNLKNKNTVEDFYKLVTFKRPSLIKGSKMPSSDRALSKSRSDDWLKFIKGLWNCSGLFHVKSPKFIQLTEYSYDTLVAKFSKYIFEKIFKSIENVIFEGVAYPVITLERKYI
jgi:hypothetical protein